MDEDGEFFADEADGGADGWGGVERGENHPVGETPPPLLRKEGRLMPGTQAPSPAERRFLRRGGYWYDSIAWYVVHIWLGRPQPLQPGAAAFPAKTRLRQGRGHG